jgi:cell division protein FtsL
MSKVADKSIARRRMLSWMVVMLVLIGEMLAYTWCRVQWTRASYDLERARHTWRQLSHTEQRLQTELASLRMPQRIEAEAAARLGMGRATPEQIVRLR